MFDSKEYAYLLADVKQYLNTRWELFKLDFLEKLSRLIGMLLFGLVLILLLFAIIGFGGLAAIYALSLCMPLWAATLIIVACWLVLLVAVICFRKQLFVNPIIAAVSAILFESRAQEKERKEVGHA